jgi:hypothetical protein
MYSILLVVYIHVCALSLAQTATAAMDRSEVWKTLANYVNLETKCFPLSVCSKPVIP